MKIQSKYFILSVIGIISFIVGISLFYNNSGSKENFSVKKFVSQDSMMSFHNRANADIDTAMIIKHSFPAEGKNCLTCHKGIEPIRSNESKMMQQIYKKGNKLNDPNGCVVCHGGNPNKTIDKEKAHSGAPKGSKLKHFTPVPASLNINENTCGLCHKDHTYNVHRSIMNTDAGKMKSILSSWGINADNYDHIYGDHDMDDPDGNIPRFGSDTYKQYMLEMAKNHPGQFPKELKMIPETNLDSLKDHPEQAAYGYLRSCNKCHLKGKGSQDRGHFRGMGCAACHMLYSNEGYYEGKDESISKNKDGHVLVHSMQGTRKSKIRVNGQVASGVQNSTCAACHSAGRRIGHAYQGLMAFDHKSPFNKDGDFQQANSGYIFKYIRDDVHHKIDKDGKLIGGMLCQDCHTTNAMHGNGNIGATTLASIEIECADCHGTVQKFPWELPIGYGDEFGKKLKDIESRGLSSEPMKVSQDFATVYESKDGYLKTARGNALGNVVKDGKKVILHSASGVDFEVPLLKQIEKNDSWSNKTKAKTAMSAVPKHMESLECYACHSTWAAQYYGYQYKIDYSKGQTSTDWLKSSDIVYKDGTTADYGSNKKTLPGVSDGDYSHVRWEEPPLGINGEGRVTPLVGCIQTVSTIIDKKGEVIMHNHVAKNSKGIPAIELAPLNPHTTSKTARECKDCHGSKQAQGYGIDGGVYNNKPDTERYADATSSTGKLLSKHTKVQISAIKGLYGDFMKVLNKDGKQIMSVGSHWKESMPLTKKQRIKLERTGTCTACHQDIPNGSIPMSMLGQVAKVTGLSFKENSAHAGLIRENNIIISWIKSIGIILLLLFVPFLIIYILRRKKINATICKLLRKLADII